MIHRNRIHDWLDSAGFSFRAPLGALVDTHGLNDSADWHDWPMCAPPGGFAEPLSTALVRPFGFHVTDYSSPEDVLDEVYGVVDCGSPDVSFVCARNALVAALGPGTDRGAAGIDWADGRAAVRLSRARPGSKPCWANTALVEVYTGWRRQLTDEQCEALSQWQPEDAVASSAAATFAPPDIVYEWPDAQAPRLAPGAGQIGAGQVLVIVAEDGLIMIPRAALTEVCHSVMHPARAGGFEDVTLHYRATGFYGTVLRTCGLANGYAAGGHAPVAAAFAHRFGLPLRTEESAND